MAENRRRVTLEDLDNIVDSINELAKPLLKNQEEMKSARD